MATANIGLNHSYIAIDDIYFKGVIRYGSDIIWVGQQQFDDPRPAVAEAYDHLATRLEYLLK